MKIDDEKDVEKLVRNLMKEVSLEQPAPDFTSKVMGQVAAAEVKAVRIYKPLISTIGWVIIWTGVISMFVYFFIHPDTQNATFFKGLDFASLKYAYTAKLPSFEFSNVTLVAAILLVVMLFFQIAILKNYYNKRFNS